MKSNFAFLNKYWADLAQIGFAAEGYLYADPNACIYKLGLFSERIVSEICRLEEVSLPDDSRQVDKIRKLSADGFIPENVGSILTALRKARNDAVHTGLNTQDKAKTLLRMAYNLSAWFMEVYGDWDFIAEPYQEPVDNSETQDYWEQLKIQEEKLETLIAQIEEIRTEALEFSAEKRKEQAYSASEKMDLSLSEEVYLDAEQIRLDIIALPAVNFALQQNHISVIQELKIINHSEHDIENITLCITSSPHFNHPYTKHIELLPSKTTLTEQNIPLVLDADFLAGLTEKLSGILEISLSADGTMLCEEKLEITVLAYDEWHGYAWYPELLTAFTTPNHPEVIKIIARATNLLEKWTGDPSLDAYQSQNPNRVLDQAAAVYGAIQELNIVYSEPPASFEKIGQRVRLSDTVVQQKMGTCLDLTLLYTSCLEAIGLNPLMVMLQGHIFAGVWLDDLSFPEAIQDDISVITKRTANGVNEIALVECTSFVAGKGLSFDESRNIANKELVGNDKVLFVIDTKRTRLSGITPLPMRVHTTDGWQIYREKLSEDELTSAPQKMSTRVLVNEGENAAVTKIQIWERKLLDLGLRNTLINMRISRLIPLLTSSIDELEDALADGSDFSIISHPADWHLSTDANTFDVLHDLGSINGLIQSEFKNKRLRSSLSETELQKKITDLYRSSRTALEENGANALYLAIGLLRWYETSRSTKPRYAPLILLPVELVRRGASRGYIIRLRDEDPQMNITLLEKVKQDFGITINGLDPLPQDAHGIDTRLVFTTIRKAIMGQPRWDVLESAYLGIFSFSQFVMWNDIRNRSEELTKNKIVRSLIDGKLSWDAQPMNLNEAVSEDNIILPLTADASQLYAINAACNGESFVLHGPPGTGKSQTITALIANALAHGQRVLFVAEKMAALEVVQKRLNDIGIEPFCLELHSNKSKKKDVLEQLRQSMDISKDVVCEQYSRKAEQAATLRTELGKYVTALHKPLECGMSLFDLITQYEDNSKAPDVIDFSSAVLSEVNAEKLEAQSVAVDRLIVAAKAIGHPSEHSLGKIKCTQYSQKFRTELPSAVSEYQKNIERLENSVSNFCTAVGWTMPKTLNQLKLRVDTAQKLNLLSEYPTAWVTAEYINSYSTDVETMAKHYITANEVKSLLLEQWNEKFLTLDGQALQQEYDEINAKWFLPKLTGMNSMVKRLSPYCLQPLDKEKLPVWFGALSEYKAEKEAADALFNTYGGDMDELYSGDETDWNNIIVLNSSAKSCASELDSLVGNKLLRTMYAGQSELADVSRELMKQYEDMSSAKELLYNMLDIADSDETANWLHSQEELCQSIIDHKDELREWITWNKAADEAKVLALNSLVLAYENGLEHEQVRSAYDKSIAKALAVSYIDTEPVLSSFSGNMFDEEIQQFKHIDEKLVKLSKQEIFCRLAANVPDCTREAAQNSELGILQRAIRSNGRGTSIRRLFEQIPNLLPRLCPCMLMSPISAAQYLDPKLDLFDLVVFDEASQLTTSKAVGALARGKNAVIVGDPKQMPPTSFFASNALDEDNIEIEDLESILDDCLALNMPQTHLLWHYRSRHESLIAFSNHQFYKNKLYTFPSVSERESSVSIEHVAGIFDRGKSRQNQVEAEAVVAELVRRCHDNELSSYSVGVVTFNISQQNLIEDLLVEACKSDAELEDWAFNSGEPVFIKNLESVQGDERDVILFSIGYGPDKNGVVSVNFGPLNREGGWRRLNVAVSRARYEMKVFSSMYADQINLARTNAEGVAALRAFLEYAERGKLENDEASINSSRAQRHGIVNTICAELSARGYKTEAFVGHSAYRVDIGVIDPKDDNNYILGILLDGDSYNAAKTVRDREIGQINVLNSLGWNTIRIWTMDWWDNSNKELSKIFTKLDELKSSTAAKSPIPPVHPKVLPVVAENGKLAGNIGKTTELPSISKVKLAIPVYKAAKLKQENISPEFFEQSLNIRHLQNTINTVIQAEAPISESLLTRRVVQSYGISRAGSRIQAKTSAVLTSMDLWYSLYNGQRFFWKEDQNSASYDEFRASGEDEAKRDARDVPIQEAANAICYILYNQVSLLQEDLIREAAKIMGYARLGSIVVEKFSNAIDYAQSKGRIELSSNGRLVLTSEGLAREKQSAERRK